MSDVIDAAVSYAARGWYVVPVQGKSPHVLGVGWPDKATCDSAHVAKLFRQYEHDGVGVVLGKTSDIIDIECDDESAEPTLAELFGGVIPATPMFGSTRGKHRLFRWNTELPLSDQSVFWIDHLEFRTGNGGKAAQTVFPPSNGRKWIVSPDEAEVAEIPTDVIERIRLRVSTTKKPAQTRTSQIDPESVFRSGRSGPIWDTLIAETQPAGYGTRRRWLFELARRIRGHLQLMNLPLASLKPFVLEWHRRALPFIRTKCPEETWADFIEAYRNVDLSRCGDAAVEAMKRADANELPPVALKYPNPLTRRFIALCVELARISDDGVFYVSSRKAARVLGLPGENGHKQILRRFDMLCVDGVLEETEHGGPHNYRASRYRFIGHE